MDVRCITKNGKVRYLPEKLAKDKAFLRKMELTVQDAEVNKKEVEGILLKPEPLSTQLETEKFEEKEPAKRGRKPKESTQTDGITNE